MSLHVISDTLIALAYFTIPFSILRFVRGRSDLDRGHLRLAFLFAAFIALCGLTHVISIVVLWVPIYIVEGWIKAATAIASLATAGWLMWLIPIALKLPLARAMQLETAAHRETTLLLSTVIELIPGVIHAKDRSGRLLLANKAALDVIGKDWSELEGKRDDEFLDDPCQAAIIMANDRRIMDTGTTQELEEIVHHPERGARVFHSTKVPFGNVGEQMRGIVGFSRDITDRKIIAKALLHVARRTAMGDMAAAIAHEVNQPLAAVSLYLGGSMKLLERDPNEGLVTQAVALANDECLRAGDIIRRVRSFVSGGGGDKLAENVPLLVDEACSVALLGSIDGSVITSIEHDNADLTVLVDKVQIEQVIENLVLNALEAMGDAKDSALRVATGYNDNGMAMVSVSDNGPGMSAEVTGRLFEPFVSTKGVKGVGLGLSICRTIVENHGGKIWADSDVERGTTFRFTLPSVERELAA